MATATSVAHWQEIEWSPHVHDATIGGRTLRYVDIGDGPPLLLIHGLGGCWQWWLEVIPELAEHHRVVAVDLPGFGNSEMTPLGFDMSDQGRAMLELIDVLDLGPVTVGGHSMAGLVMREMAKLEPEKLDRMILVNAGGVPLGKWHLAILLKLLSLSNRALTRPGFQQAVIRRPRFRDRTLKVGITKPGMLSGELASELIPLMAAPGFLNAVATSGKVAGLPPEAVETPTLLLWGDADPIVPAAAARALDEVLPNSTLVLLPGIGHSPMVEAPRETIDAILEFTR